MSCKKAQGFLDTGNWKVTDQTDASKERRGAKEALALADGVDKVLIGKGKKVVTFDMKRNRPDDETLLAHLLGPTGYLRAPSFRRGKTLVVGYSEDAYRLALDT
jgi:hypothetical protein